MVNKHSYMAGAIDCDGSIVLAKQHKGKWKDGFTPRITLTNTNKDIVLFAERYFREVTGGNMRLFIAHKETEQRKEMYRAAVQSIGGCKAILDSIRPYLVCKTKQADLLMEWLSLENRTSDIGKVYWERLHKLNS